MSESNLKPEDVKALSLGERELILCDALSKTIENFCLEYNVTITQVIGCLNFISWQESCYLNKRLNTIEGEPD